MSIQVGLSNHVTDRGIEPRVGRSRPLKGSISNLRLGIGPDRSGMNFAMEDIHVYLRLLYIDRQ